MSDCDPNNSCATSSNHPPTISVSGGSSSPIRSDAAERMRRYRERRRNDLRCLMIELRETEIVGLIRRGLLKSEMRNDTDEIITALYTLFERTIGA
jgi:hypothetical protein